MISGLIKDATPQVVNLGAQDLSTRNVPVTSQPIPQHLPLFYTFAEKGPNKRELVGGDGLTNMYGARTFDLNDKFYTHQTRYLSTLAGLGNTCMVHRLIPLDAGEPANVIVYACVADGDITNYERNFDGTYKTDVNGNYISAGVIKGSSISFMKEYSGVLPANVLPSVSSYLTGLHYQNTAITAKGSLTSDSWTLSSKMPNDVTGNYGSNKISGHSVVETKSRVYIIGGYNWDIDEFTDQVFSAIKNADGSIGDFVLDFRLPFGVYGARSFITNGYVYIVGGDSDTNKTFLEYQIDTTGNIIPSSVSSRSLPHNVGSNPNLVVVLDKVYIIGGESADTAGQALVGIIDTDGYISSFSIENEINWPTGYISGSFVYVTDLLNITAVTKGYKAYLFGGRDELQALSGYLEINFNESGDIIFGETDITDIDLSPVYVPNFFTDPQGIANSVGYVTKDRICIYGGESVGAPTIPERFKGKCYTINLDSVTQKPTTIALSYTSEMLKLTSAQLFVTSTNLYIIGGSNGASSYYGTALAGDIYTTNESNFILTAPIADGWNINSNYYAKTPHAPQEGVTGGAIKQVSVSGPDACIAYPIFEFKAANKGSYYNNLGFSIVPSQIKDIDAAAMVENKSITYNLSIWSRQNENSSPSIVKSLYGDVYIPFSFKPRVTNSNTGLRYDMENVFGNNWYNELDTNLPYKPFEIEPVYVYHDNIEMLLNKFTRQEMQYVDDSTLVNYDFSSADNGVIVYEQYLMDMFGCKSTNGVPYVSLVKAEYSIETNEFQSEITFSTNTPVFLSGGSDGTTTNAMLDTLVRIEMEKYADAESEYQDTAVNVESIFYDTGFDIPTKRTLVNFIMKRKDTALVLSTHESRLGNKSASLSTTRAIASMLKSSLNLAPESTYYGTPVARAIVVGGTMLLRDGSTDERIPLTYEVAYDSSRMMGAGNGKWKAGYMFDNANTGSIITQGIDIQPSFVPAGVKPALWNAGLVWAQNFDRTQYYFPAMQTVYPDDTSVLNSYFNIMVLCTLNKIGEAAWRQFTGTTSMTNGQFINAVTAYVNEQLTDRFAGMVTVIPEVVITSEDELRGYSWQLINKLYGNNSKTAMVYSTQVYRASDLTTATN
jgi:hypothetical protein